MKTILIFPSFKVELTELVRINEFLDFCTIRNMKISKFAYFGLFILTDEIRTT